MRQPLGPYKAEVIDVHDGDTVRLFMDLGFGIKINLSCRLYKINAPELNTIEGIRARDELKKRLPKGTIVDVYSFGWDKYGGRFDGVICEGGDDINTWMVTSGYAEPYL